MTLSTYLFKVLSSYATLLSWTTETDRFELVVSDAIAKYPSTTEAGATDLLKLHAIGKAELWAAVLSELALMYDYKADKGDYKKSQMYKNAENNYLQAKQEVAKYDSGVKFGTFNYTQDPYDQERNGSFDEFGA